MNKLPNYVLGEWRTGEGEGIPMYDAVTGEGIGVATAQGIDYAEVMAYGRAIGGPPLRKLTFQQRGLMLKQLALYLFERRKDFYELSYRTGATKRDSWVDIEGGIGNLFANASLRRKFPDSPFFVD